jgi:DtxR family transcriptional regulator, Mn-dependent transcriptional regulator
VTLPPEGEKVALEVIRHHRLLETYLVGNLGLSWTSVHQEARRLEHVISEEFKRRIDMTLGYPVRDPHGAPIPSAALVMPPTNDILLRSLRGGGIAVVSRARREDSSLLRRLESLGLMPGAQQSVLAYSSFDANLTVRMAEREPAVLGATITS